MDDKPLLEWLSTEQAAHDLGMSPEWVRRQIKAGRLRATMFRTGRRPTYRIEKRDLRDFLLRYACTVGPKSPSRRSV